MSIQKINDLILAREKELAFLLENRGTDFPVVERQNDLRISFIELELIDLKKLIEQPLPNEKKKIVIELEMSDYSVEVASWHYPEELDTENLRYLFSNVLENERVLEQEKE